MYNTFWGYEIGVGFQRGGFFDVGALLIAINMVLGPMLKQLLIQSFSEFISSL